MIAVSDSRGGVHNPHGLDIAAARAHKRETGQLAGPRRDRADHERGAAPPRLRPARALRARAGDHRRERRPREGADDLRGRERPRHAGGGRDPRGQERPRPARHPRERGRGRRLVLRVGAGPPGVLLARGRGEPRSSTRSSRGPSPRPGITASATTSPRGSPRTGSPSSASPRRRSSGGCTRRRSAPRDAVPRRGLPPLRGRAARSSCARGGARLRAGGGRDRRRPRARGSATASASPSWSSTGSRSRPTTSSRGRSGGRFEAAQSRADPATS